jgi:hypothetical protein
MAPARPHRARLSTPSATPPSLNATFKIGTSTRTPATYRFKPLDTTRLIYTLILLLLYLMLISKFVHNDFI